MRMTVTPHEASLVETARQLEKLQARRAKLAQELIDLDAEIAATSSVLRQLLPAAPAVADPEAQTC